MKKITAAFFVFSLCCAPGNAQKKITLPNGWSLSPAGRSLPLGDLPLNMAMTTTKKLI